MNDPSTAKENNDEDVKATLSMGNKMLAQMVSDGIQGMPKEIGHTLSYEALKTALQDREFLKHLLFKSDNSFWGGAEVRQWVVDLLSRSFTDDEVKEFRDGIMKVLKTDHRKVAVEALTNAFMRKVSSFDFDSEVNSIVRKVLSERDGQ